MLIIFVILFEQFFRNFLENEVIKESSIQWKRELFFNFIELYQKKGVNNDILGKIFQYLILPCFSLCYKNGEQEKLLCTQTKSNDNIIGIILSKVCYRFYKYYNLQLQQ